MMSADRQNRTIAFLAEFCSQHLLDEKILIVPLYPTGRQIGEALTKAGHSWVNLRFAPLISLAHEVCAETIAKQNLKQITSHTSSLLVDKAFIRLKQNKKLDYFQELDPKPGIIKAFTRSLMLLRMNGISSESLSAGHFINQKKGNEICLLLSEYEKMLESQRLLDKPGLYLKACKESPRSFHKDKHFLCFEDGALSTLEKSFLHKISQDSLTILPRDPVFGVRKPRRFHPVKEPEPASSRPTSDSERTPWLFAPYKAPAPLNDSTLSITTAVGPSNECKEVFRRILSEKIPVDEAEVICPPGRMYHSLFDTLSQKTGVPVTLSEGMSIGSTSPGKLFSALLNWMESDFKDSVFWDLLESGHIRFKKQAENFPLPNQISAVIKKAGIGWGKERYVSCLERLKEQEKKKAAESDTEELSEKHNLTISRINQILTEIKKILQCLSAWNQTETIDFQSLVQGIRNILSHHARIQNDLDAEAITAIYSRLDDMTSFEYPAMSKEDALEQLRFIEDDLTVGSSGPAPGHTHISTYRSGGFSARQHTFILGLNRENFPGTGFQDPILLDEERENISLSLRTTKDSLRENLYSMARLISSLRGKIYLSYSSYDILGERESFPSSLMLQAFRLIKGDPRLDYSALINSFKESKGFFPARKEKIMDETEWWLEQIVKDQGLLDGVSAVKENFPALGQGINAISDRKTLKASPYEGVLDFQTTGKISLLNENTVMSSSRFECLAFCPFKYFMEYVLGVRKPEAIEYDPSRWLDPLNWGTLVHEVLYQFMNKLRERGEKLHKEKHRELIRNTAENLLQSFKEKIPPPSEDVFLMQKKELMETLDIFLKAESQRAEDIKPLLFEVRFGTEGDRGEGIDEPVLMKITPRISIGIRGRIDRIDRLASNRYRVIDYKSGRYSRFEQVKSFGKGQVIQHALYSLAAETILKKLGKDTSPRVKEGAYYFPTAKGEGREIVFKDFDRHEFVKLLSELIMVLIKGDFVPNPDALCDYCDLAPLCGTVKERAKIKRNSGIEEYSIFERLANFE